MRLSIRSSSAPLYLELCLCSEDDWSNWVLDYIFDGIFTDEGVNRNGHEAGEGQKAPINPELS
jgi:hypothetical protein